MRAAGGRVCGAVIAASIIVFMLLGRAQAGEWVYQSDNIDERAKAPFRFATKADLWFARFNRPSRACDLSGFGFGGAPPPVRHLLTTAQVPPPSSLCLTRDSQEVGVGTGLEVAFRLVQPLYITAGIEVLYTIPERKVLKNQVIVPASFGVLLTMYEWPFRPIARFTVMPLLYLTDDARDYTFGAEGGFAWRILDWGDLSFTVGYKTAATVKTWLVELGLHPIP